jgi:hypothetical protein
MHIPILSLSHSDCFLFKYLEENMNVVNVKLTKEEIAAI